MVQFQLLALDEKQEYLRKSVPERFPWSYIHRLLWGGSDVGLQHDVRKFVEKALLETEKAFMLSMQLSDVSKSLYECITSTAQCISK